MEHINQLIKEFDFGKDYPSKITKAAAQFIKSNRVKCYGWNDAEFVNGYQDVKETKVTVMLNNRIESIWHFRIVKESFGKVGYIVRSWCDQLDVQISKDDGNTAYLMIVQKAKEINGAKIIVETF